MSKIEYCLRVTTTLLKFSTNNCLFFRMAEKKKEAESAVELMSATFERIQTEEEKRKGLIILKALYGNTSPENLENGTINSLTNYEIDVTIPLQCLIKNSKLILQDSTKVPFVKLILLCDFSKFNLI